MRKKLRVQVDMAHLPEYAAVVSRLRDAGMLVQDEIQELGNLSGVAEEAVVPLLQSVPGVKSVRITGEEDEAEPADFSIS